MKRILKERLLRFILEKNLFETTDRLLITVSGGVDSVVLVHLLSKLKYDFGIAHCNFGLRGVESDLDEDLVKKLADSLKVNFFVQHFETKNFANDEKISIQMAARDLRYSWFQKLAKENKYDKILTAHHADDVVETLLINLVRGTGISGLKGISAENKNIIRPLLLFTKSEILDYAKENKINWREDASNLETDYLRNKVRLELIPLIKKYNPNVSENLMHTAQFSEEAEIIIHQKLESEITNYFIEEENISKLNISAIQNSTYPKSILYFICKKLKLPADFVFQIQDLMNSNSGLVLEFEGFQLLKDRKEIHFLQKKIEKTEPIIWSNKNENLITDQFVLSAKEIKNENYKFNTDEMIAELDEVKISFPLTLRKWQKGDCFYPLGMLTKKKISDFFIDNKLSINQKNEEWIVCNSNSEIIWIVGRRIDNRYKVTNSSKKILILNATKKN